MIRRRRAVAWRALALTSSTAMIATLVMWRQGWLLTIPFTLGIWACETAARRVISHAWRQRLDRFGDN